MGIVGNHHKALIAPLQAAMYDFDTETVQAALQQIIAPDAIIHMPHPFGDLRGGNALYETCYQPLFIAFPDLERRDYITIAGTTDTGDHWVGCAGYYTGIFVTPWLDIPATGHQAHMRFHEFYRFDNDRIVEAQVVWDIPELMMQADAWPMAPSLGREWLAPAPATQDGLLPAATDIEMSARSCALVRDMLKHLTRHPAQGGVEVMELERFWHPRMNWYGPAGIGTARGIESFRNWHQIPFLNAMPDRAMHAEGTHHHFFADQQYVGVTGWPNMAQTLTHDGWLGIAPTGKRITLRSLDFWRIENAQIRENWVLLDLLDIHRQLGVDVLARMKQLTKSRKR